MSWSLKEPDIEILTREALNLLSLEMDELYTVLGCQLLASAPPTRTADIMTHVRELRNASKARKQDGTLPYEGAINVWMAGVEEICNDLKNDGIRFVENMREEFKKGLCTNDILDLANDVDESKMQIVIMIVSAILKIPAQFDSISATLAAMFCKSLLRDVCR
jgi:hypothetical protein